MFVRNARVEKVGGLTQEAFQSVYFVFSWSVKEDLA